MKKRQATSKDIPAVKAQLSHSQEIEPLQPQLNRQLSQRADCSWQKLAASTERINQLSAELEAALFELKEINSNIKHQQNPPKMVNILDYQATSIPYIHHKRPGLFVLKAKAIDLFAEEKAAFALAHQLRRRTKIRSKRSKSRMSVANISWRLGKFLQKLVRQWRSAIACQQVNNQAKKIDLPLATKTTKMESRKRFVLQR